MNSRHRLQQAVKALVMIGLALFLYTRFTSGLLYLYIAERFAWITLLSVFGFLAVGLSYDVRRKREPAHGDNEHSPDAHEHAAPAAQHHGHDHTIRWSGIVLMALPILLGVLISPRPLGAAAMANREVTVNEVRSAMPALVRAAADKPSTSLNVLEWQQMLSVTPDTASLADKQAKVLGFVYRDERFAEDQFFLARFTISCCVADATPAGLVVQSPNAAEWESDQWVEISGFFGEGVFNGVVNPVLFADSMTPAEVPIQPYLYP